MWNVPISNEYRATTIFYKSYQVTIPKGVSQRDFDGSELSVFKLNFHQKKIWINKDNWSVALFLRRTESYIIGKMLYPIG